jgi:hypothetical protein
MIVPMVVVMIIPPIVAVIVTVRLRHRRAGDA